MYTRARSAIALVLALAGTALPVLVVLADGAKRWP